MGCFRRRHLALLYKANREIRVRNVYFHGSSNITLVPVRPSRGVDLTQIRVANDTHNHESIFKISKNIKAFISEN